MTEAALAGMRVLDLTHYIAGPFCTKFLADYGAEVIKIERPGVGDLARRIGPFFKDDPHSEKSSLFLYLNLNKKSITLDLKTQAGARIFKEMVRKADAVVESFSPGVMSHLGLDYETLEKVNPGLVMTSISNFGQAGPYRDYKATHIVLCALGGWTMNAGDQTREPPQAGGWISHYMAGLMGALGTATALYFCNETGIGQHVDISMMEAMFPPLNYPTAVYSYLGDRNYRVCNRFPWVILTCKDGYIGVNMITDAQWESFCIFIGRPELIEDPRFQLGTGRLEHSDEIIRIIHPWLLERNKEELFHTLQEWRVPFSLVPTTDELPGFDQHKARGYFVEVGHPAVGRVTYPGAPFRMGETPWQARRPAPLLGEHNDEVYGEQMGFNREDLVRLRESSVI